MFFNKKSLQLSVIALGFAISPLSAKATQATRVVDFTKCYTDSSFGKREQENNDQMKAQMEKAIKELNDQLSETSAKLNDEFVRDSLSPEAEKELQDKMQTLSVELQRYQQQYYYMMQQANYKTMNIMAGKIKEASKNLAKKKNYTLIINKDQVFHYTENLDVTEAIISELDNMFKAEASNKAQVKQELSNKESEKK
ncbi:MAG: hypothetical protein S4CHLAM20_00940 [Chlamydiia bacterium]|nr:hypothetical protein [Chlamydiia bacterium]